MDLGHPSLATELEGYLHAQLKVHLTTLLDRSDRCAGSPPPPRRGIALLIKKPPYSYWLSPSSYRRNKTIVAWLNGTRTELNTQSWPAIEAGFLAMWVVNAAFTTKIEVRSRAYLVYPLNSIDKQTITTTTPLPADRHHHSSDIPTSFPLDLTFNFTLTTPTQQTCIRFNFISIIDLARPSEIKLAEYIEQRIAEREGNVFETSTQPSAVIITIVWEDGSSQDVNAVTWEDATQRFRALGDVDGVVRARVEVGVLFDGEALMQARGVLVRAGVTESDDPSDDDSDGSGVVDERWG
ncbi:hypothetical protein LTR62_007785 [Meristemomyces frigidus]|uniref:Uncharacterized protein n=1 Tax=Meristemomyces frigidus TaxID=1508187 RepID=A0AAN7TE69_9PEZI|nr:hypothetical protein LTR62_007785 [Meristemomyces frigidus]